MAREHGWYLRFLAGKDFIETFYKFINVFFVELIKVQVKTEDVASMSRVPNIPCCLAMFAQHVKIAIAIFHRFC